MSISNDKNKKFYNNFIKGKNITKDMNINSENKKNKKKCRCHCIIF